MTMTTEAPAAPRSTAMLLHDATELLADLLRRAWQCEKVCHDALAYPDDDILLDVHGARQAITILGADLGRIAQDCMDQGLLDTSGDVAVKFQLAEPQAGDAVDRVAVEVTP